ncbi:SubName: Full=Related to reticuline oxidase (Berberine bridge enzyme) {ECO:0000313/EMBL:CCA70426.1} [Serendipita indica DSM 11827]|uniref:Related to reticuline oxidase (Berberine bridge enzyme) n=1 Tax=Serendipita indica (strain DSM 11827) TaxID=1109443 RepID=G4TGH8_SERID|nr:SubName: Full=Related to reticuline oxidase (Berberine bridge enzyme) {ECO:0000313/EMBL:CCA70426.1} [Serendipita indica DSM 11827]CCA70426.1 related to reticuline oxidase (berberine bridge enzyme) [Serendipita indica DSM 11827]
MPAVPYNPTRARDARPVSSGSSLFAAALKATATMGLLSMLPLALAATTGTNPTLKSCLNNVFASNKGAVSYPTDLFYQLTAVKPYNTDIKVTPAAVTRPTTTDEVSRVVQCAAAAGLKVQPRSGGHSYGNYCIGGEDGAVVVDLVNFQKFSMDTNTWFATFGSGTLLGDLTDRLFKNGGRAIAHGTCPQVGSGGHLTIGGLGPLSRQYGAALDHVEEVEVVLANGTITRASNTQNTDLFFAMKGAAASFGIITEFVVHTEPAPADTTVFAYHIQTGKKSSFANTFAAWQDIISDPNLDRKFSTEVVITELGMIISGTYFGTKEEYKALNFEQRLAQNATVSVTTLDNWLGTVTNWAENEALKLIGGISGPFYSKSLNFKKDTLIPFNGIQNLFNYLETANKGTPAWFVIFDLEGGKINDVPTDQTAYAHRDTLFYVQTYAVGILKLSDTTKNFINGINKVIQDAMPNVNFGAYAGYVDPQLPNAQQAYWQSNLPRLEQVKRKYDPTDVFHNPQSVRPASS